MLLSKMYFLFYAQAYDDVLKDWQSFKLGNLIGLSLTRNLILVSYNGTNFYHAQQTPGINSMTESQEINRSKRKEKNGFSQEI